MARSSKKTPPAGLRRVVRKPAVIGTSTGAQPAGVPVSAGSGGGEAGRVAGGGPGGVAGGVAGGAPGWGGGGRNGGPQVGNRLAKWCCSCGVLRVGGTVK